MLLQCLCVISGIKEINYATYFLLILRLGHAFENFFYTIHHSVLATKQTLLSILLANHALLETYLQDEDSQVDTQSKLEEPLVNA